MSITPRDPADFTPARGNYTELKPFRFWCQKVLPLVYDDSLSYYELLCKVVDFLNKTMEDVETLEDDVTNIYTAYNELQEYVNTYFSSLDVQEEIDNKLDAMASDGSLSDLIEPFIPDLVSEWLNEHITPTTPAIDNTLSVENAGADAKRVGENISDYYENKTYNIGDYVLYNGYVYKCITTITTPESFNANKWTVTNITNEFSEILEKIKHMLLQPYTEEQITNKSGYYDGSGFHSGNYESAEYTVGDEKTLYITCSGNAAFAGYYIYNENGASIARGELDKKFTDFEIDVPENGKKIGLNKLGGTEGRVDAISVKIVPESDPLLVNQILDDITENEGNINDILSNLDIQKTELTVSYNSLKQDLCDTEAKSGRFNTSEFVNDASFHTVFIPLKGLVEIDAELRPANAYTYPYTFVDDENNIISQSARIESDRNYDITLSYDQFPSGATKIAIVFKEDHLSANLIAYPNFFNYKKGRFEIQPIVLRKFGYSRDARTEGENFCCSAYYVKGLKSVRIDNNRDMYLNRCTFLTDGYGIISYDYESTTSEGSLSIIYDVPENACWVVVSNTLGNINTSHVYSLWDDVPACNLIGTDFYGKSIVWLGTSIPANGFFGYNSSISYPALVGSAIGAYVINEAVGSSDAHCRLPDRVTNDNPYGFEKNFESASRCLSNSIEMMNWIKNHYNSGVFTQNVPSSITQEYSEQMNRCSYENKIDRYLAEDCEPDFWVFDHGRNDNMDYDDDFDSNSELTGIESNLGYGHGVIVESATGKKLSFDVSNEDTVIIDFLTTAYYDYWDLLDGNGNVISYSQEVAYADDIHYRNILDVSNAATLCISTTRINSVSVKSQKELMSTFYFRGAANFIFNRIKEYNPKSRIIMIGHYEDQMLPDIAKNQLKVADYWSVPIMKLWGILGWSQKYVKTTGNWVNGHWDADARATPAYMTELNIALADGLHPGSDLSGNTLRYEAKHIEKWIKNFNKYGA